MDQPSINSLLRKNWSFKYDQIFGADLMTATSTINATDFKARCLEILDQLAAHKIGRVAITKRGKVVAVLTPPEGVEATVRALHGCMRGSVVTPADFDLTAPVLDEAFGARDGALHG